MLSHTTSKASDTIQGLSIVTNSYNTYILYIYTIYMYSIHTPYTIEYTMQDIHGNTITHIQQDRLAYSIPCTRKGHYEEGFYTYRLYSGLCREGLLYSGLSIVLNAEKAFIFAKLNNLILIK